MNEIFEKTRELGEVLLKSDEYRALKLAERRAMSDSDAAQTLASYMEKRSEMEEILRADDKDWAKIQRLTEEIDKYKRLMDENESIIALENAKNTFSELIDQINGMLRFIVTGQIENGSCTGDCSGCDGCTARVN